MFGYIWLNCALPERTYPVLPPVPSLPSKRAPAWRRKCWLDQTVQILQNTDNAKFLKWAEYSVCGECWYGNFHNWCTPCCSCGRNHPTIHLCSPKSLLEQARVKVFHNCFFQSNEEWWSSIPEDLRIHLEQMIQKTLGILTDLITNKRHQAERNANLSTWEVETVFTLIRVEHMLCCRPLSDRGNIPFENKQRRLGVVKRGCYKREQCTEETLLEVQ